MAKIPFHNKYATISYLNTAEIYERECEYIIIKSGDFVVCQYDKHTGLYSFPIKENLNMPIEPTSQFTIHSYINENNMPIKEKQHYNVYIIDNAVLDDPSLQWCALTDILINKIKLNGTQKQGLNNLLVRIGKNG